MGRSIEDIRADIDRALALEDLVTLGRLSNELLQLDTPETTVRALRLQGVAARMSGDLVKAIEAFHAAMELLQDLGDRDGEARITASLAGVYYMTGDYPRTLELSQASLEIFRELRDRHGVANTLNNIGLIHADVHDAAKALQCFEEALEIYEKLEDQKGVAIAEGNLGIVYDNMREFTSALMHFERAARICQELGNDVGYVRNMMNVTSTLIELDRQTEARSILSTLKNEEINDPAVLVSWHASHARINEYDGDLHAAESGYLEALAIAVEFGIRPQQGKVQQSLRDLAAKRNDLGEYIRRNEEMSQIKEELVGRDIKLTMAMHEKERELETMRTVRDRERAVLYSALPRYIADRVIAGESVTDHYDDVSVLFVDVVNFTSISERISPHEVITVLKSIFKICEDVARMYGLTTIKTIGDAYLAVAGVPTPLEDHALRTAQAALTMMERLSDTTVRVGIHCGPVVAGIVGEERLQFDIWGDTVNIASRMESTGEPGRVHVSEAFVQSLRQQDLGTFPISDSPLPFPILTARGYIEIKGKGLMPTFWLGGNK